MCGTIRRTLGNKSRKDTQMNFYKIMAVPILLYGSETWVTIKKDKKVTAEIIFLRAVQKLFQTRLYGKQR